MPAAVARRPSLQPKRDGSTTGSRGTSRAQSDVSIAECASQQQGDDDGPECRICKDSGQDEYTGRLLAPCLCQGSSRWVHEHCLTRWRARQLRATEAGRAATPGACEVCGYEYRFRRKGRALPLRARLRNAWRASGDGCEEGRAAVACCFAFGVMLAAAAAICFCVGLCDVEWPCLFRDVSAVLFAVGGIIGAACLIDDPPTLHRVRTALTEREIDQDEVRSFD